MTTKPTPGQRLRTALKSPDAEKAIAAIKAVRTDLDQREADIVNRLRSEGVSWQRIADLTGMKSRQAAQFHFERDTTTS